MSEYRALPRDTENTQEDEPYNTPDITVRELAGDIMVALDSEIYQRRPRTKNGKGELYSSISMEAFNHMIDLITAVIARHTEKVITIDSDFPVEPLPCSRPYEN